MALRPPEDFRLAPNPRRRPSDAELRAQWERDEAIRERRARAAQWRRAREGLRRDGAGELRPAAAEPLPGHLRERLAFGPDARAALRPAPRPGGVAAAGVDTWSPCWYAEPGTPPARAMRALASRASGRAWLLPEPVAGHRAGWFPDAGLLFAEGRPGGEELTPAAALPATLGSLAAALAELGIPVAAARCAGLRRLDVAADVWTDSPLEGLALLECIAAASIGAGKLAAFRAQRCAESVLVKTRAGRTTARVYDKGAQTGAAPRGRWLRLEAQWRFPRGARPAPERLDGGELRRRFARRFEPLWQAAGGLRLAAPLALAERLGAAVAAGQLAPSRARSLAGYLLLGAAAVPQGARRTTYELERECRELGLAVSLDAERERRIDAAEILDRCMAPGVWGDGRT